MKSLINWFVRVGIASCIALSTTALAQVWTFDSSAQGWRINDLTGSGNYSASQGTYAVNWNATGGSPGGFISAPDPSDFTFMFQAPSAQLGNYTQFLGGKLNFSLQTNLIADYSADSVIVLRGGGANQTIVSAITPQPLPTFMDYSIPLVANVFHYGNLSGATVSAADFASVLGGLNDFLVDADYHNGVETTGLDRVAFVAADGAVPEPSTYGLLAAVVLSGLAALRRLRLTRASAAKLSSR